MEEYPIKEEWSGNQYGGLEDINSSSGEKYQEGYDQAMQEMNQITEDYVSYEIAVLLKEKGFNESVRTFYTSDRKFEYCAFELNHNLDIGSGFTSAPTHQMAMAWLREVHNLHIEMYRTACGYLYIISNIPYGTDLYNPEYGGDDENSGQWTTYERCVEAALKYTLENLI